MSTATLETAAIKYAGADWHTPKAIDAFPILTTYDRGDKSRPRETNLAIARRVETWSTPKATDAQGLKTSDRAKRLHQSKPTLAEQTEWPTPCVPNGGRQPKGGSMTLTGRTPDGKKRQVDLSFAVRAGLPDPESNSTNGKRLGLLNPAWVTQLMGYPDGWLDVEPQSLKLWETP